MSRITGNFINFYNKACYILQINKLVFTKFNAHNAFVYSVTQTDKYDFLNHQTNGTKNSLQLDFKRVNSFELYYLYFFARITFRGKSYRLRSFNKTRKFIMNFGYSHWTRLWLSKLWFFGKRKKKKDRDRPRFMLASISYLSFQHLIHFLPKVRIFNPYTYRGLRLRKQHIVRRPGKINQHISILH